MLKEFSLEKFDAAKIAKLDDYIANIEGDSGEELIHVLHYSQRLFTFLPKEIQLYVAKALDLPASKVFGVASFYSYFNLNPVGKYTINICMGTACFVRGAEKVLDEFKDQLDISDGETTIDKMFTLKNVRCVGACGLAPVVMINEKVYGHVGPDDVAGIIEEYRNKEEE